MTLKPTQILQHLENKRQDFKTFDANLDSYFRQYQQALADAAQDSIPDQQQRLRHLAPSERGAEWVEALQGQRWICSFGQRWDNREQSLEWAKQQIAGVSTFAVDGSQIYPGKDLSLPVALVQIGWYENRHTPAGDYQKDIWVDVMTPVELKTNSSGDPADRMVNRRRFELELARLQQYLEDNAGNPNCLALFDGALVATFAEAFDEDSRRFYVRRILNLLEASQRTQVPLVAYIDTSYAADLVRLLQRLYDLPDAPLQDPPLIGANPMQWGDRTPLFRCRRAGILKDYEQWGDQILFTYLKAHDNYPVRLEMPAWIYQAHRHEQVLDWVRCEIIAGGGYPYAIETADQTAVLKAQDRAVFFRLFQQWAEAEALPLRLSRKMVSKIRRR
jgi:hypothetical protein